MVICKHCDLEFEGKFCPDCGQKSKVKRITTKAVMQEVRQRLLHYDSGFFYTMIQPLRRPGHTIREYIQGRRAQHFKPIKFVLWATALNFLIFHLVGYDELMAAEISKQHGGKPVNAQLMQYIFDHPSIVLIILIPNIALFSYWYFKRHGYNYAEHVVLNVFLMGEVSLFGVLLTPLNKYVIPGPVLSPAKMGLQILLWFGFVSWGYVQFFQPRRKWWAWLKAMLAVLSGYLFLMIVISVLTALVVIAFWPWLKPYFQQ